MGAGLQTEGTATGECDSIGKGEGTQPEEPEPLPRCVPRVLRHCCRKGEVVVSLASSPAATRLWHGLPIVCRPRPRGAGLRRLHLSLLEESWEFVNVP